MVRLKFMEKRKGKPGKYEAGKETWELGGEEGTGCQVSVIIHTQRYTLFSPLN